jgi:hypothetical protein
LTLPCEFSFEAGCNDVQSIAIFNTFIHPCILPAEFCGGRQIQSTFEYYQPNMLARKLGCGQVPPRLFLHEFLKLERISRNPCKQKGFCSPSSNVSDRYNNLKASWDNMMEAAEHTNPRGFYVAVTVVKREELKRKSTEPKK